MSRRYIDADALGIGRADRNAFTVPEYADGWNSAIEIIENAPIVDVVEVVRCKDCVHYHEMKGFDYKGRKAHHCVWHSALRGENDYCSDGIRREE